MSSERYKLRGGALSLLLLSIAAPAGGQITQQSTGTANVALHAPMSNSVMAGRRMPEHPVVKVTNSLGPVAGVTVRAVARRANGTLDDGIGNASAVTDAEG